MMKNSRLKHGDCGKRLYKIWAGMCNRCQNSDTPYYMTELFVGWLHYPTFKRWALANGYRDSLTIDRIKNSGGYVPSNLVLTCNGVSKTSAEWAEELGVHRSTIGRRLKSGMPLHVALFSSSHRGKCRKGSDLRRKKNA